jgi:hypothetical protein
MRNSLERFREKRALIHLLLAEIAVERHRYITDENPAQRSDSNLIRFQDYQTLVTRFLQAIQLRPEVLVE